MIGRRTFIASAGAFVALRAKGEEKPLWKAGIVTDTHVYRTPKSCRYVKMACDLFAEKGIDIFVNCGDIADRHFPEAYPILKELTDAAFPGKEPKKIWVYAYHDYFDRQNEPWETVMGDVKRLLGATNDFYDLIDMHGYPLIVFPQWLDIARGEKMIKEVCEDPKYAGKPVFVFDHIPPRSTTENTVTWGNQPRRDMLSRYPRVVSVNGHVHCSLRSELNIWQGAFTAVNIGCLQYWGGHAVGLAPQSKQNFGAVVMEVFPDRLVFRRYDVRTKEEYSPDEPWTVPLPFDPATAPYRRERCARTEPVPQFPAGAALSLKAQDPFADVEMSFPRAEGRHGTFMYKLQVSKLDGDPVTTLDMFGQFYLAEGERAATVVRKLSAGYFDPGKRYRVRVFPCNCFGVRGRPIEAEFAAPANSAFETVFESSDPMAECPFMTGRADGRLIKAKDGWYEIATGDHRLVFPDGVWKGKRHFRFTVDMETKQGDVSFWTIVLRNPSPERNANARISTPNGDSGRMRYVIEFDTKADDENFYLLVREGEKGKIRFNHVKIERS